MEHHPRPIDFAGNFVFIGLFLIVVAIMATRFGKMDRVPRRFLQNAAEQVVETVRFLCVSVIGPHGAKYVPFVGTVFFFIMLSNLWGQFAWLSTITYPKMHFFVVPPTASLNINLSIALIVFLYVQYEGIRSNGFIGYIKHFWGPVAFMGPMMLAIEIIGEIAKPVSLSLRLYGNIFGEEQIISVLSGFAKGTYIVPLQLPMMIFGVFTSVVQALVFTMLTCIYLSLMTSHEAEHKHEEEHNEITPAEVTAH